MKKASPYIAVIIAMLIWAGSGIAVKAALESFAPLMLVMTRFTIGVLLMCCIGLIANRVAREDSILRLQKVDRKDIWLFVLGGVFQPFLYFILETYSYDAFATPTIAEAFLSTNLCMDIPSRTGYRLEYRRYSYLHFRYDYACAGGK